MNNGYEKRRARYLTGRQKAIEYLGGKCVICGVTENLQFHHRNPWEKSFEVSANLTISWVRLVLELDKCELRCPDHHDDCTVGA